SVSEAAHSGTGTDLANYSSNVACDSNKGSESGTGHSLSLGYGDKVTCTITNSRVPTVKVVKQLDPSTDGGTFDLSIGNSSFNNGGDGFGDGGSTGFHNVDPGSISVGEAGHTGTSLSDYVSEVSCDSNKGSENPATSHSFNVGY